MVEKTIFALPAGTNVAVPRLLKRFLQIALTMAITAGIMLVVIVGNGLFVGRGSSLQTGVSAWLSFIRRPDILATIALTALVAVFLVHWQRNHERRRWRERESAA